MEIFTKERVARRNIGNRASPVDRAHMKRLLGCFVIYASQHREKDGLFVELKALYTLQNIKGSRLKKSTFTAILQPCERVLNLNGDSLKITEPKQTTSDDSN